MKHVVALCLWVCLAANAWSQLAPTTDSKHKPYIDYVKNYYASLNNEVLACEKKQCEHHLRLLEFTLNAYDTCQFGQCNFNKHVRFWYKINASAEKIEDAVNLLRIDVADGSYFWEKQQFVFENNRLIYYGYSNPLEIGEFVLRDSAIISQQEFYTAMATQPEQEGLLKQYQQSVGQWKNIATWQQQSARYLDRLHKLAELYMER